MPEHPGPRARSAGRIDQDCNRTQLYLDRCHHALGFWRPAQVGRHRERRVCIAWPAGERSIEVCTVAGHQCDLGSLVCERFGARLAYALARPGHDHDLALQMQVHVVSSLFS